MYFADPRLEGGTQPVYDSSRAGYWSNEREIVYTEFFTSSCNLAEIKMTQISFIIPAYNEQKFIGQTINSINTHGGQRFTYEIIVVDHGSVDKTAIIAKSLGARVLSLPSARTISELRNAGASQATSGIFVFLDADTAITEEWALNFAETYADIGRHPEIITGSKLEVPPTASWVSRLWFRSLQTENLPTHIGSGHFITSRKLFDAIGGFSVKLETGEDYDFCARARRHGARIVARPQLRALHYGVPDGISQFFSVEVWHGRGDWLTLRTAITSKVALASTAFILCHAAILLDLVIGPGSYVVVVLGIFGVGSICVYSSLLKYHNQPLPVIAANTALFYIYYWARSMSFFSALISPEAKKRMRET